jgi:hypothetical protein
MAKSTSLRLPCLQQASCGRQAPFEGQRKPDDKCGDEYVANHETQTGPLARFAIAEVRRRAAPREQNGNSRLADAAQGTLGVLNQLSQGLVDRLRG